ncbi:MAG: alpha/beta fold hydrolase [Jatrophihabitantaceae bacterium]
MSRYVLIPGAGGVAWYWSRVVPLLEAAGQEAVAVDLPGDDESAGVPEYAAIAAAAAHGHDDVVLVAQSIGGFTAPAVCEQTPVRELVFVNAMIPAPGESAGEWWGNVGSSEARVDAARAGGYPEEFDLETYFLHDVPPEVSAEGAPYQRNETDAVFEGRCEVDRWRSVPTRVLVGADDRFFPAGFQARVARERLGIEPDVLPGGHLIALANPAGLAQYLLAGAT